MVATIGRITAGSGYEYLTGAVATGTHDYYAGNGEAPGRWFGAGTTRLGLSGEVQPGQMAALFGQFLDPRTVDVQNVNGHMAVQPAVDDAGRPIRPVRLGAKPYDFSKSKQEGATKAAVAGFDVQFAPSKSVSALWALADEPARWRIEAAHEQSISVAFGYLEQHTLFARAGRDGVRQVDAEGFIVARYRHRTSRNGDPQLHTHCAVLNRVWCEDAQKWRTIDGTELYRHKLAVGAVYAREFEERLVAEFGVTFDGDAASGFRELAGIDPALTKQWSSRRTEISDHYTNLAAEHRAIHGELTRDQRAALLQKATTDTRRPKTGGVLHERWVVEAGAINRDDVHRLTHPQWRPATVKAAVERDNTDEVVKEIVERVSMERSTFYRAHVAAIAGQLLPDWTAGTGSVTARMEQLTAAAVDQRAIVPISNVMPTPNPPDVLRRRSGESQFDGHGARKFSTLAVMHAEERIVQLAERSGAPTLERVHVARVIEVTEAKAGHRLGSDQLAAVHALTTGEWWLTTVIGPAGTGKTTMLQSVVAAYHQADRQVYGLSLSQNATQVLEDETGASSKNIARWFIEGPDGLVVRDGRKLAHKLGPGDLIIVDEAAMVPTRTLDDICAIAQARGARVALVGDPLQLSAPEAGGVIRDLIGKSSSVELAEVRRFTARWERDTSLLLRDGDPAATAVYDGHERLRPVTADEANTTIIADWWTDHTTGRDSVIVADTNAQTSELAALAQVLRVDAGEVRAVGNSPELMDANRPGIGDLVQSRKSIPGWTTGPDGKTIPQANKASDGRRIANRDIWTVIGIDADGIHCERVGRNPSHRPRQPATFTFSRDYAAVSLQLAYAGTVHAVQGRTVDVCRALITPGTGASALYVAMTRGRNENVAYVQIDGHDHVEFGTGTMTAAEGFTAASQRDDRQRSARSMLADALASEATVGVLTNRLHDVADLAASSAWLSWSRHHLPTRVNRRIDNDPEHRLVVTALADLVGKADLGRALATATDDLTWRSKDISLRIARALWDYRDRLGTDQQPKIIDPDSNWEPPPAVADYEAHVIELHDAIRDRTRQLETTISLHLPAWTHTLEPLAEHPALRAEQLQAITAAAVYREKWNITNMDAPLGTYPTRAGEKQRSYFTLTSLMGEHGLTLPASAVDIEDVVARAKHSLTDALEHAKRAPRHPTTLNSSTITDRTRPTLATPAEQRRRAEASEQQQRRLRQQSDNTSWRIDQ